MAPSTTLLVSRIPSTILDMDIMTFSIPKCTFSGSTAAVTPLAINVSRQCSRQQLRRSFKNSSPGKKQWGTSAAVRKTSAASAGSFVGGDLSDNGEVDSSSGEHVEECEDRRTAARTPPRPPLSILFAAGGTGGHVYPAIAIAEAVRCQDLTAVIHFAGTRERMEWTAVPAAGFPISPVPAISLKRPVFTLQNLLLPFRFAAAVIACIRLIRRIRPNVVIGTGGYVSAPTCLAAFLCGRPVLLQEQNAYPGLANRLLGWISAVVFIAFEAAARYFPPGRCILKGNPVRAAMRKKQGPTSENDGQKKVADKIAFWQWAVEQRKGELVTRAISKGTSNMPELEPTSRNSGDDQLAEGKQDDQESSPINSSSNSNSSNSSDSGISSSSSSSSDSNSSNASSSNRSSGRDSSNSGSSNGSSGGSSSSNSSRGGTEVLLVLGGSLGAAPLNAAVGPAVALLLEERPELCVVWQTGERYIEGVREMAVAGHPRLCVLPFIDRMELAYAAADLVVSRAGAITCSELLLTQTPSILVPSPNVAEDHQTANARAMAKDSAALLLPESQLSPQALQHAVTALLDVGEKRASMSASATSLARPNASRDIAIHVLKVATKDFTVDTPMSV